MRSSSEVFRILASSYYSNGLSVFFARSAPSAIVRWFFTFLHVFLRSSSEVYLLASIFYRNGLSVFSARPAASFLKFWLIPNFIPLFIRLPSSSLQKINNFFSGWFFMFQHVFLRSSSSSSIQIAPTSSPPDPQRFIPKFIRLFIRLPSSSFQKIQFPVFLSEWSNIIWEVWKRSLAAMRSWISLGD